MRYIDADKLIAKIEKVKNGLKSLMTKFYYATNYKEWEAEVKGYETALSIITFLQQEQPENDIKSPFTGGKVAILSKEEEVTFRGEKVKILRKYYRCEDTGREFTDSKLDDDMMWTVFRAYCEKKGMTSFTDIMLKQEQLEAEKEVEVLKDIERDAVLYCFDNGINITPRQAKEFATHYLILGHNEGYIKGRKDAHVPAKQLGLPSSLDKKSEVDLEKEIIRYQREDMDRDTTVRDVARHFIADTVVKTDMKDIVKAMEEGVRLGMEEQKSAEMRDSRQIALMIDNGRRSGVIEGRKQVVDNPEEYGLCKPSEWSEEDENHFKHILNVLEDVQGKQMEKGFNNLNSDVCWFESLRLRTQPHWKPSKVQIGILWDALSNLRHDGYKHMEELESLYNDIKKL
jgi:hypothetical protein